MFFARRAKKKKVMFYNVITFKASILFLVRGWY